METNVLEFRKGLVALPQYSEMEVKRLPLRLREILLNRSRVPP